MINVAHSHPVWLPQTQTWMHSLVQSLPDDRVRSHIYCLEAKNLDQFKVPRIHELTKASPMTHFWNRIVRKIGLKPLGVNLLGQFVEKHDINIVHSHFGQVGAHDSESLTSSGVKHATKHVVTFYGFDVSRLPLVQPSIMQDYAKMFATVDMVLCEGPFMANEVVTKLGCAKEKVFVQRLGVDLNRFEFRPRSWKPDQVLKILVAGSFREKKGIPFAIRAIGEFAKQTEVQVTIVGDATQSEASQKEKSKIVSAIDEGGLRDRVTMLGFQPHSRLTELAYEHHIFVSPSVHAADGDSEGGAPVTLIEMAAMGMPIVSSFHCDIPEVIVDGETGWLAKQRDVASLVERLETAVASHHSWGEILKAGRSRMESLFDLATQGEKLTELYEGIV